MNYREIIHTTIFGAKSINLVSELASEFIKYYKDESEYSGKFWVLGKSILAVSDNRYVYLFKTLNSKREIVRIDTPENFPDISESEMFDFCSKIIEKYNENYSKF